MATMTPAGFVYRNEDQVLKMSNLIRECHSNAENYKATNALILMCYHDGFDYLLYLHDGKPFNDLENDILVNGCTPNVSGEEGKSFQGAGLVASACANHIKPMLMIGSKIGKKFCVGIGKQEGNRWVTADESKPWTEIIEKWVGVDFNKYNVAYAFRVQWKKEGGRDDSRTALTPPMMNMIGHMMLGGLQNLNVHFCQQEIGFPYEDATKRKEYASFETAGKKEDKKNKTGSVNRRALSFNGYQARFREQSWTINCDPFNVSIPSYNDIILPVQKARIVIDFYPAEMNGPWMKNLRAGILDGTFSKDGANEFGNPPVRKIYLYCPWIYEWAAKNEKNPIHYSRFSDNSVGVYKQHCRFFNDMNLPYADRKGPFMVAQVFLDEFGPIPDTELSPHLMFGIMDRRSDFTFGQQGTISKILLSAANAAVNNVPQDLKDLCDKHYKVDVSEFVPLGLEGVKIKKKLNRLKNVEIFDLDNNGQPFDGEFSVGKNYRLVIVDQINGMSLSPQEVQIDTLTRGVELKDLTDIIGHIHQKCETALNDLEATICPEEPVVGGN